jgi:hypothetical protein
MRCGEPCKVRTTGYATVARRRGRIALTPATATSDGKRAVRVKATFRGRNLRRIAASLKRGRKTTARIRLSARTTSGSKRSITIRLRLKRR